MPDYGRIVVAVDDSDAGKRAFAASLLLAKKLHGRLLVVSVVQDLVRTAGETMGDVEESYEHAREHLEWLQRPMLERARQDDIAATGHILVGRLVERVLELVREQGADLIVIGGFAQPTFLGLRADWRCHLAEHAPCDILIAK